MKVKKNIVLITCISSIACSYVMGMQHMQRQRTEQEKFSLALKMVEEEKDICFSGENNHEDDNFCLFAKNITQKATENGLSDLIGSEEICKSTAHSLAEKMWHLERRSDYFVAKKLAQYIPHYKTVCTAIESAFDPESDIQSAWYANATKYVPVKYCSKDTLGYNGGVMTPLSFAIKTANLNWCKWLIAAGADVNKRYSDVGSGIMSTLYEAINLKNSYKGWGKEHPYLQKRCYKQTKKAYQGIVTLLLKNKVDIGFGYSHGSLHFSPLKLTIDRRDKKNTLLLWSYGARLVADNNHPTKEDVQWLSDIGLSLEGFEGK